MSAAVRVELDRYLVIRRAVGFKLARSELLLADYIGYLEAIGEQAITTNNAVAWASLPPTAARVGGDSGFRRCGASPGISM